MKKSEWKIDFCSIDWGKVPVKSDIFREYLDDRILSDHREFQEALKCQEWDIAAKKSAGADRLNSLRFFVFGQILFLED